MFARLFSKRIRELENNLDHCQALLEGRFNDLKLTHMHFEDGKFDISCLHEGVAGLLSTWAFNTLKACDASNYVEFEVRHPTDGGIVINIQKRRGETPATKVARLEKELAELRAAPILANNKGTEA